MRRDDDIKEITYGDVKFLSEGSWRYFEKSKTDQEGHGFCFQYDWGKNERVFNP